MAEKILTIVGPTASGKTSLAIDLAKKINGEVISLDSRQIYKGMCIGTAQPTREERSGVKHHLIGCFQPSKYISSGKYFSMVKDKISEIKKQNKKPIICGGSGLYYRAIQKGIFKGSKSNLQIRDRLDSEYFKNPCLYCSIVQSRSSANNWFFILFFYFTYLVFYHTKIFS